MKTTEWFPDDSAPVRDGLYETRVAGGLTWSAWKDGLWHFASTDAKEAVERAESGQTSFWQVREWRGLKEPARALPIPEVRDELLVSLYYAAQGDITRFRIRARQILAEEAAR